MTKTSKDNVAFELKGSLFTLTALHLLQADSAAITEQLRILIQRTPKFFQHMPLVIDLHRLPATESLDFEALITQLRELQIIPVGIRGSNLTMQQAALAAGLAILPNTKAEVAEPHAQQTPEQQAPTPDSFAKIITQPVRSGQQIYAPQTDLVILAPVSPGAELLADGNIHVYNTLRGRALAGVTGNTKSRIFCQHLEAELIAIAGHYWVSEDLQNTPIKQNAHVYLENDRLHIGSF